MTREKSKCSAAMLTALLAAINCGRRLRTNTESFIRAVELGWFADYQIKDLSYDLGLEGFTDELLADAGVTLATYHYRPRRIDHGAGAFQGLRAADMVRFLIYLERLGLNVDPALLVDRLLPQSKQLRAISWSELSVLWFVRERHKWPLLTLYTPSFAHRQEPARREDFKTEAGYKISAYFVGDEVHFLEIRAPRYRYRADPELIVCEVCGIEWLRGDPASSLVHRREHKKRLAVLQPSPDPQFLTALANETEPELVTSASPIWRHRAIYARALMFQREFHYDFVQWDQDGDDDPKAHGFLFNDDSGVFGHGAIVGACAFRWREYTDHLPCWAIQWIWIAPKARRHGILSRRWGALRALRQVRARTSAERGDASVRRQTRRRRSRTGLTMNEWTTRVEPVVCEMAREQRIFVMLSCDTAEQAERAATWWRNGCRSIVASRLSGMYDANSRARDKLV